MTSVGVLGVHLGRAEHGGWVGADLWATLSISPNPGGINWVQCASHTCCFLHTTNLIAKSLIHVFDVWKKSKTLENVAGNDDQLATELTEGLDEDEQPGGGLDGDNIEGLIDLTEDMEPAERVAHEKNIQPVKLVLAKVRSIECDHTGI